MSVFKRMLSGAHNPIEKTEEYHRKYRLIQLISIESSIIGVIILCVILYLNLWFLVSVILIGEVIAIGNLFLLWKNYNLTLCSYIINSSLLMVITITNLWIGGLSTSFFGWFYVPPVIAAITIGIDGLIIYSLLSTSVIFIFISGYIVPSHFPPTHYISLILDNINHIFIFFLITTTLYNLLTANKHYETLLREQNYLLYADKQKFHYLSHHDSLTNLPNRSYFHTHLQAMMDKTNTKISTITLYFMDLDGFKNINDKYGHEIGDLILLHTSKRLKACFREKDFIARLGGDEFTAVITYNLDDKIADILVKRIESEFKEPFLIKELKIKCSISIGKANYPKDTQNAETLIKMADDAMYRNKNKNYMSHTDNQ